MSHYLDNEASEAQVLQWAKTTFGTDALNPKERAFRLLEESIELCQAFGIHKDMAHRLVTAVYEKPLGDPIQEIGGIAVCLAALCARLGISRRFAFTIEFNRCLEKAVDTIRPKYRKKIADGLTIDVAPESIPSSGE